MLHTVTTVLLYNFLTIAQLQGVRLHLATYFVWFIVILYITTALKRY